MIFGNVPEIFLLETLETVIVEDFNLTYISALLQNYKSIYNILQRQSRWSTMTTMTFSDYGKYNVFVLKVIKYIVTDSIM